MFKALLVIYVVAIGSGDDPSGSLTTTPFETMEQCEMAIKHAEDVIDGWHYGKDKTNLIPLKRTMKCFDIPPGPTHTAEHLLDEVGEEKSQPFTPDPTPTIHKRWHDK